MHIEDEASAGNVTRLYLQIVGPDTCHKGGSLIVLHDMILLRAFMFLAGAPLVAGGIGLTMIGVFAFIGMPMLILGLGLISAAISPRT